MGKGSNRRPEDRAAIERNWPFPPRQPTEEELADAWKAVTQPVVAHEWPAPPAR